MFAEHRKCTLNRDENRDFQALRANQINVSCECHQRGYEWSSRFGLCVDINECVRGTHNCTQDVGKSCLNLPGHYTCVCRLGYVYDPEMRQCIHSPDFERALKGFHKAIKPKAAEKPRSLLSKVIQIITRSAGSSHVHGVSFSLIFHLIAFIYSVL